jgi:ABC-type nitrate/sulfonate/bicarbonate transport system, ATPase component
MEPETILVSFSARPKGSRCPFGNAISFDLRPGGCVWLRGSSGRGKSTLASYLCNILPQSTLDKLQISASCQWNPSLQPSERCGVLFQQTTLLDELTVAGNLAIALDAVGCPLKDRNLKIKQLLDMVGLSHHDDADKMPTELSGGMGRRASLALQLAQNKHVIFLDEPFAGLDLDVAASIAQELVYLRKTKGTAFILISHEPELAEKVMDASCEGGNIICHLQEPPKYASKPIQRRMTNLYRGTTFMNRFWDKLVDYFLWSLPLILLAFLACGLAISMLTCETLRRMDVSDPVLRLVDKEIRPLIKMLTGQEATPLHMLGVKMKVSSLLNQTVPPAKATLYAIGMTKLFVLEIGPLLTALLLCGRIGGSYAGKLATMQATSQTKLLKTLGVSPMAWSLYPAALAVSIAGPLLTSIGTFLALYAASLVGSYYGIGDFDDFWEWAQLNTFPTLRLSLGLANAVQEEDGGGTANIMSWNILRCFQSLANCSFYDFLIEIITYPPIYHFVKAQVYIAIILGVAEISARIRLHVTPRKVPSIITQAVVTSGLFVILADWFFSQLLLKRK